MTEDSFLRSVSRFLSVIIVILVVAAGLLIVLTIYFMDNFRSKREEIIKNPIVVTPTLLLITDGKAIDTVYVYQFK